MLLFLWFVSSQNTHINLFATKTLVGENANKGIATDVCWVHVSLVGDNTNKGGAPNIYLLL
jgi:hypothetical protein